MVKRFFPLIFLLIISIIPLLPLLHAGLPLTHDGQDHVVRIANFYQSLTEGNLVPRWAGNLNWGYGHPVMMFLYPLPSYFASFFHSLGFSLVDSIKLVFGLSFILSGLFMYFWLRDFLDDIPALAGGLFYIFAPYRFVDLYVRGAIGEHVAFVFPPLICLFLLKFAKSKKNHFFYFYAASISLAGLVLAHNAITIMFLPFLIVYAGYLFISYKLSKKTGALLFSTFIFGFSLSAFFLIPAYLEGKYTLRDIVTGGEVLKRFVSFNQLIYGPWSYGGTGSFSVQLGPAAWISIIAAPIASFFLFKKNKKILSLLIIVFAFLTVSIFIMLPVSEPVWKTITTLQKFQFPWRFLSISVFMAAVLGALLLSLTSKKLGVVLVTVFVLFLFLFSREYWQARDYLQKNESFYTGVYNGTTDTGESAPIWSVRFMEKRPGAFAEVIEGEGNIKPIMRTSTHHKYEVDTEYGIRMRENTLYFPGWEVYINDKEYKGVQFQDPENRGLMTFFVLQGKHTVDVIFKDTRLRQASNFLSLVTFTVLSSFLIFFTIKNKKTKKNVKE